ncbi:methylglyoxal reductase (NADPH-dependent) gre2 [Exophiala sp. CCFEE 6388]|nr:methylglyoxal reductase (NADPH-dependent) gre2 [Eurotiomycetes sp. CCFEE 6388]
MPKVLLTGGSGFIAAHILDILLARGYDVVTTVRSKAKGDAIFAAHPGIQRQKLSYVTVEDVAEDGAFDESLTVNVAQAVKSNPPLDYVIHTASPFHSNFTDPIKELLNPAINGTTGILRAIKAYAPTVRRVVITSSFAAIANSVSTPKVYDESSWNPVTWEEAVTEPVQAYRGSKTFAEKAAWKFVETENPHFDLATMNPPLVYGPVVHDLNSLDNLNTSNQRIRDFIQGKCTDDVLPPTGTFLWTDVRDLALAHVRAIEVPEAGGKRFLVTAGLYSMKRLVDAIRQTHPELSSKLPKNPVDDTPANIYGYDNSRATQLLGINFRTLEMSVQDTVASLLKIST